MKPMKPIHFTAVACDESGDLVDDIQLVCMTCYEAVTYMHERTLEEVVADSATHVCKPANGDHHGQ